MLDIGGAERLMVDLLPLLHTQGNIDVDLLLFNGVDTPFKNELKQQGIQIFELGYVDDVDDLWSVYNPRLLFRLKRFMGGYDIIHTHNTACQLYVPIAKSIFGSSASLVTTEHNSTNRRRSKSWFKPIDRWMYKQYDGIICISDQTRQNLEDYIGKKDVMTTIYNGVDISRFLKPVNQIDDKHRFVITMVAAFREQKDHGTILRAMKRLPESFCLRFVGRGETEDQVKQMCGDLGLNDRVSFMGMRSDVQDILDDSDIIVLSSHWEGLSLSSIEGMASGRPFVASDVDGLREIVSGAGVLFPHGDDEALANSIQQLCDNPSYYRQVAEACQERAKGYDISIMADKYLALYKSL
jgi:glycosyltransferase involved in cell wall biosynthesis